MPSDGNNLTVPPDQQEIEVSIFGPGFGECLVLHLGAGDWTVVDSCLDLISKRPAALSYLESLGVDAAQGVRLVVATHWHDDHMQGISSVFKAAQTAIFACTNAIREPEFNEVLSAWTGTRFLPGGSGVDELRAVLDELRKRNAGTHYPAPRLASVGKILWARPGTTPVTIKALSPSDAAVLVAVARLSDIAPKSTKVRRRLPNLKPNDASIVRAVQAGEQCVLLGADLHVRDDRSLGWLAIVDGFNAGEQKHQVFKVPHHDHGSPTGYHVEMWQKLVLQQSWAATTPFVEGRVRLPSVNDCERILAHTQRAYLTAPPQPGKFRDLKRTVEKAVNNATLTVQCLPGKYGHVRLRKRMGDPLSVPWRVELFGSAVKMQDYVQATLRFS